MENIQGALTDLLATIVTGCITLVSVYITFFINKTIENLKSKEAEVEIYDSPKADKNLKKLEYQEFFGCKYKSDDFCNKAL